MADRIYRALLLILPGWFRDEFGANMASDFRDSLQDGRRNGALAAAQLWLVTTRDMVRLTLRLRGDAIAQDLRYAVRSLARSRAFTLAAVGTLALGMGPTMIVANLVERVIVRPLPFARPEQLVSVWNAQPEKGRREFPLSVPDYVDFRDRQDRLAAVAAHTGTSVAFVGSGEPRQIAGVLTTAELHAVLGVQPVLGRALTRADSAPGAPPVILLGHTFWKSEFGGRPNVIGELVKIDGAATEIVGVLPDGIEFPNGSDSYWVPLTLDPAQFNRGSHFLSATGRLANGVTIAQASDALNGVARALGEAYPSTNAGQSGRARRPQAAIERRRAAAARDPWRGDRCGPADRVHERREPARGARLAARAGACAPHGNRRNRSPPAASTAHRAPAAGIWRSRPRARDGDAAASFPSRAAHSGAAQDIPDAWRGRPTWRSLRSR